MAATRRPQQPRAASPRGPSGSYDFESPASALMASRLQQQTLQQQPQQAASGQPASAGLPPAPVSSPYDARPSPPWMALQPAMAFGSSVSSGDSGMQWDGMMSRALSGAGSEVAGPAGEGSRAAAGGAASAASVRLSLSPSASLRPVGSALAAGGSSSYSQLRVMVVDDVPLNLKARSGFVFFNVAYSSPGPLPDWHAGMAAK